MIERQAPRVERVTLELDRPQAFGPVRVALLADERVPAQPRLDPDLVAAPRLQPHFDERRVAEALDDAVVADRFLRARIARMRLLLDQRLLVPHQVIAPAPARGRRMTVDDGEVDALRFAALELRLEPRLRRRVLREDDEAGRVLVDPVNDQRPPLAGRPEMPF